MGRYTALADQSSPSGVGELDIYAADRIFSFTYTLPDSRSDLGWLTKMHTIGQDNSKFRMRKKYKPKENKWELWVKLVSVLWSSGCKHSSSLREEASSPQRASRCPKEKPDWEKFIYSWFRRWEKFLLWIFSQKTLHLTDGHHSEQHPQPCTAKPSDLALCYHLIPCSSVLEIGIMPWQFSVKGH